MKLKCNSTCIIINLGSILHCYHPVAISISGLISVRDPILNQY